MKDTEFQDRCVLVTGAGVGIGFAICRAFAEAGATVGLNDIDEGLAHTAAERINQLLPTPRVRPYAADVADVPAIRQIVEDFSQQGGGLDVVVANAGLTSYGAFLEYEVETFDRVSAVNLRGSYFTAQAAARKMISLGHRAGRIILMASVTGIRALNELGAYGITKAGIRHMARVLALELGPYGLTVNAIAPGAIRTERTLADDPDHDRHWSAVTPTGRGGQVEDIAATALFLSTAAAGHITGQTITIDGGWSLSSPMPGQSSEIGQQGEDHG